MSSKEKDNIANLLEKLSKKNREPLEKQYKQDRKEIKEDYEDNRKHMEKEFKDDRAKKKANYEENRKHMEEQFKSNNTIHKASYKKDIEDLEKRFKSNRARSKEIYKSGMERLERQHKKEITKIKTSSKEKIKNMKKQFKVDIEQHSRDKEEKKHLKKRFKEDITQIETNDEEEMRQLEEQFKKDIEQRKIKYEKYIENLENTFKEKRELKKTTYEKNIEDLEKTFKEDRAQRKTKHEESMENLEKELEKDRVQMKEYEEEEMKDLEKTFKENIESKYEGQEMIKIISPEAKESMKEDIAKEKAKEKTQREKEKEQIEKEKEQIEKEKTRKRYKEDQEKENKKIEEEKQKEAKEKEQIEKEKARREKEQTRERYKKYQEGENKQKQREKEQTRKRYKEDQEQREQKKRSGGRKFLFTTRPGAERRKTKIKEMKGIKGTVKGAKGVGKGTKGVGKGIKWSFLGPGKAIKTSSGFVKGKAEKYLGPITPGAVKSELSQVGSLSFWWILILVSGFLFYSFVLKYVFPLIFLIFLNIGILFFIVLALKRRNYKLLSVIFIIEILFLPQISGFLLDPLPSNFTKGILSYIILISPWAIYIAIVENPRENILEKLISVLTVLIYVFYIFSGIGLDTVTAQLGSEEAELVKDRVSLLPGGNQLNQATGWLGGLFDSSKYSLQGQEIRITTEPKGVVFSDTEIIRKEFLDGQKITLLKEIRLLTPEEGKSTTVKLSCTINKESGEVNENLFELNNLIVSKTITCTNTSKIDKTGNVQVIFKAEYNHSTKVEIHPPFIKENSYKNYLAAGQDPFEALGFQSRKTEAYIENSPLNVRFQIGNQLPIPLPELNQEDSLYGNPIFGLVFEKNNNLENNVRTSWEGKISETNLSVHLPQGLAFEHGDTCGFMQINDSECDSLPYAKFIDELNENSNTNIECPSNQLQKSEVLGELEKTKDQINVICPLQLQKSEGFFGTSIITVKPIRIDANYKVSIEDSENIKILKIAE